MKKRILAWAMRCYVRTCANSTGPKIALACKSRYGNC
jgi:hypothetical protein